MKVWITGAERSLGAAIGEYFLNKSPIGTVVQSLSRPDWDLTAQLDVVRLKFRQKLVDEGCPDVFIHNAGITKIDAIENVKTEDIQDVMQVNFMNPMIMNSELVRAFHTKHLAWDGVNVDEAPTLRIIHIASMGARMALRNSLTYCASKAAVVMMAKQLAKELSGRVHGVSVFAVSPNGIQDTAMINQAIDSLVDQRGMTREQAIKYNCQSPLGRLCTMEEVSETVYWIATEASEYMTGHNFELQGGLGW